MINLDVSNDRRFKAKLFPSAFAAVKRTQLKGIERDKFHFFGSEEPFEKGFYVCNNPSPIFGDKPMLLEACFCAMTKSWGIAQRKDGEFLFFYGSDNTIDMAQTYDDFILSGLAVMSKTIFGDKFYSELSLNPEEIGDIPPAPFYVYTTPLPVGYYLQGITYAIVVYILYINLPTDEIAVRLAPDFSLAYYAQEENSMKETVFNAIKKEFFNTGLVLV